ncbi:UNVERIFIED_ORG: hypothetical protein EDC92_11770 [Dietzia maris]|uniref:VWA domain-containing protein n=1 Tax=Dietzia maris TaxID=37915 RepID=UPI0010442491
MPNSQPGLWPSRPATSLEIGAARALARSLDRAADRGADDVDVAAPLPPGRLNLAQAMQADAQATLGLPRTARPFVRTRRRQRRSPALRVGIAIDRSPSMAELMDEAASAAWTVTRAGHWSRQCHNTIEVVDFDREARLTRAPAPLQRVPVLRCDKPDGLPHSTGLPAALSLLDRRLGLAVHRDDSRLVIVISDSALDNHAQTRAAVSKLHRTGVKVLWVSVDEDPPEGLHDIAHAISVPGDQLLSAVPDAVVATLSATPTPKGAL